MPKTKLPPAPDRTPEQLSDAVLLAANKELAALEAAQANGRCLTSSEFKRLAELSRIVASTRQLDVAAQKNGAAMSEAEALAEIKRLLLTSPTVRQMAREVLANGPDDRVS
jgi:hypothetical protein